MAATAVSAQRDGKAGNRSATAPATKRARKNPGVYSRARSANYLLRMAPEELEALKSAAAGQGSTVRDFVLVAALRAAGWPLVEDCKPPEQLTAEQERRLNRVGELLAQLPAATEAELKLLLFGSADVRLTRTAEATT